MGKSEKYLPTPSYLEHCYLSQLTYLRRQGPVVQNLTKLLANVKLKFLSWNMANTLIFFAEKMWVASALQKLHRFCRKNIYVFENTLTTLVNEFAISKLINNALNNWALIFRQKGIEPQCENTSLRACAPSETLDPYVHYPSQIRVFPVNCIKLGSLTIHRALLKTLIRTCVCKGWYESFTDWCQKSDKGKLTITFDWRKFLCRILKSSTFSCGITEPVKHQS